MKATLEFCLPEEADEFQMASKAEDYYLVIWDTLQEIRKWLKYDENIDPKADEKLEKLQTFIYKELEDRGISDKF